MEDLNHILTLRKSECDSIIEDINRNLANVEGAEKLITKIRAEKKFLENLKNSGKELDGKYIVYSNLIHLRNIAQSAKKFNRPSHILHTFSIRDIDRGENIRHSCDLIVENGNKWIKVISKSAKRILMEWITGSSCNVIDHAEKYIQMSRIFSRNHVIPKICFLFHGGVSLEMAKLLENMGIIVIGQIIDNIGFTKLYQQHSLDENIVKVESENERVTFDKMNTINLDVTAVFVLVSNLTHDGGTDHKFSSNLVENHAELERRSPARNFLENSIKGKSLIMCETAFKSASSIVGTVGGNQEKERWEQLQGRITIVKDELSERSKKLELSQKINNVNLTIFGTGDFHQVITVTASKRFVTAAYNQGVPFDCIIHEPRALSEQKEI